MSRRTKPLRFLLVGVLNTLIDFGILFGLTALGLALVPANMISTAVALTFSFVANRSFTFGSSGNPLPQAIKFLAVTLFGLWVLQPLVLLAGTALLDDPIGPHASLLVSKVAATIVSMVWNYLLYDRFVFGSGTAKGGHGTPEQVEKTAESGATEHTIDGPEESSP